MYLKPKQDEIKIYILDYLTIINKMGCLKNNLTSQEISIANKFKFEKDKLRYIIARSFLRKILSNILGINPLDIIISTNKFGKPALDHKKYSNIKFNLSHSGEIIIYAVSLSNEVGIDIEILDSTINHLEIAKNYFSSKETLFLENSNNQFEMTERFFRVWTRKEALLKAVGTGLLPELKQIDVLQDVIKLDLFSTESLGNQNSIFSVIDLSINTNYRSAIAYLGEEKIINIDQISI